MDYLPIFLNLKDKLCLVVGGGEVAARKAETLLRAGGRVTILAPTISTTISEMASSGQIELQLKTFSAEDLSPFELVIAATNDSTINRCVSEAAQRQKLPVNVVDCPELCSFIFPAIVDRSPVVVAVSSGGASPVLTRLLKVRLESWIHPAYGPLARLAEQFRSRVKQAIGNAERRRSFWENHLQGTFSELIFSGQNKAAAELLEQALQAETATQEPSSRGMVHLVGAGPGDPDLLTIRALRLIQEADIVVYDRLVSPEVLNLVRRDAEMIYAGKQRDQHTLPQEEINRLLVHLAKQGKRVVRLKGGDPFIFGRGGEEIETLIKEAIPFQVVPGITAASGCAAYAGIPLTHRDYAHSCIFLTGHGKEGRLGEINWSQLTHPLQTLVFYMGLQGMEEICSKLVQEGCSPELPAAIIQQGTTQSQKVICGTLTSLPTMIRESNLKPPTLLIIGQVVTLHDKLGWFQPIESSL